MILDAGDVLRVPINRMDLASLIAFAARNRFAVLLAMLTVFILIAPLDLDDRVECRLAQSTDGRRCLIHARPGGRGFCGGGTVLLDRPRRTVGRFARSSFGSPTRAERRVVVAVESELGQPAVAGWLGPLPFFRRIITWQLVAATRDLAQFLL